jgi:hypothetical protein
MNPHRACLTSHQPLRRGAKSGTFSLRGLILLVANKFQTGFDQPLLCGMYVDKRLAGIQAV